jgi:threonine dehydrogenase-like Zn-dependent dehydrogenase
MRLESRPDPSLQAGDLLVETLAIGVCGTDREIAKGDYGWAPPGQDRLIIGHESLGRVIESRHSKFRSGQLVAGIVRRPDPAPCPNCAVGEWDMCTNGKYTERGIKELDGYCSERFAIHGDFAVPVDSSLERAGVLVEPASVVAKAWETVERIGKRALWTPRRALVTGAGPIGLLAALMGVQRGLEVHVLDRVESGLKPQLVRDLGAEYHTGSVESACDSPDIVMECTGVPQLIFDAMNHSAPGGTVCLTGISTGGATIDADIGAFNRQLVLENNVVVGSVNANRRHYELAAQSLARADQRWLARLISRRVPLSDWAQAFERHADDVKVVIESSSL